MKTTLFAAAALMATTVACSSQPADQAEQGTTELKEISLQLPKKDKMPAALAAKLTDYRFSVEASVPASGAASLTASKCEATAAENVLRIGKYDETVTLSAKLKRNCVYTVKLDIGQVDGAAKSATPFKVYYFGDKLVDTTNVAGAKIPVEIQLKLHPDRASEVAGTPPVIVAQSPDLDLEVKAKFPDEPAASKAP